MELDLHSLLFGTNEFIDILIEYILVESIQLLVNTLQYIHICALMMHMTIAAARAVLIQTFAAILLCKNCLYSVCLSGWFFIFYFVSKCRWYFVFYFWSQHSECRVVCVSLHFIIVMCVCVRALKVFPEFDVYIKTIFDIIKIALLCIE